MSILKRGADLVYTFRFIRMLAMDWKDWDAYKEGIIDAAGKRVKSQKLDSDSKKASYTPFVRLAANIKRVISKIPGGSSKLGSFAAALYLIKEKYELNDNCLNKILKECHLDSFDLLVEKNEWFVLDDKAISPGVYKVLEHKILNGTFEEYVNPHDKIKFSEDSYPVGSVFGIDIYEAIHMNTNKQIYVSTMEIYK